MNLDADTREAAALASTYTHLSLVALVVGLKLNIGLRHSAAPLCFIGAAILEIAASFYASRVARLCTYHYLLTALKRDGEQTGWALRMKYAHLRGLEELGLVSVRLDPHHVVARGGRPRFWYQITPAGLETLEDRGEG